MLVVFLNSPLNLESMHYRFSQQTMTSHKGSDVHVNSCLSSGGLLVHELTRFRAIQAFAAVFKLWHKAGAPLPSLWATCCRIHREPSATSIHVAQVIGSLKQDRSNT